MYVRTYVSMYVCTYVCMYVCMYVRTYVCMYVYLLTEKLFTVKTFYACTECVGGSNILHDRMPYHRPVSLAYKQPAKEIFTTQLNGSWIFMSYYIKRTACAGNHSTGRLQTTCRHVQELNILTALSVRRHLVRFSHWRWSTPPSHNIHRSLRIFACIHQLK